MPLGPGKYDELATHVREASGAACVVVAVIGGKNGSGFSVQATAFVSPTALAAMLRDIANGIEQAAVS